jgi:hypothetical protein
VSLDDQLRRDFNEVAKRLGRLEESVTSLGADLRMRLDALERRVDRLEEPRA